MFTVKQKKRKSYILPYAFTIEPNFSEGELVVDVIPVILFWIFENIGPYDKKRWQMRHAMGTKKFLSIYFANLEDAAAFKMAWL